MILKFNSIEYNKFYFLFNEIIDFNNFLNKSFFNYCQMYYFNSFFIFEKRFFKKIHFDFSFYKSRFIFYYYKTESRPEEEGIPCFARFRFKG